MLKRGISLFLAGICLIAWADPGLALRAPQRADDPSGRRSVAAALTAGLEEDPLLAIWQRNKERPPFMDPLERPQLLKEWDRFWPWVKEHLEDPDSPIPHFLLWGMLLSESWEGEMEGRDPRQWVWLADQLLPRWEGVEESSQGGQRLQELKLLAALDRLLLKWARRNMEVEALVARHHRILAVWRQEFSRGDPHGLSEQLVVSFLKSLKEVAGLSPRKREPLWPPAEVQRTFKWIQKAWARRLRPSAWEASHLTPEHFPLLAELPRDQAAALFESVLPKLLYRSPSGYDSMGEISEAASFVGFWMAAESRPELKEAFLAGLAKSPVEKILDPLLEIAADTPELRTPVLRFLAVLLNLKGWFFTDQDLPWVNLIYLMNRIETPEQHLWMQEGNRLLLKGYSGKIGVPRSSPLRPLTKPLEDPDSFGPDLNGFIRREAHHVGGAHVLDLVRLRLHWWATQDRTPLMEYLRGLNTVEARETLKWLADKETAPEAAELRPALEQVLRGLSQRVDPSSQRSRAVDLLATVEEADLKSVRKDLEEKGVLGLNRLFDREIPLVRLLWQMYGPRSAEAALEAIQNLRRNQQSVAGWPSEELERFLAAFRGEDRLAALQALAELHSAVRQEILQASRYPKWRHEGYEEEYARTSEVHHGISAVRGYNPRNLNFQLYILLEYVRPLAEQLAGQLIRQAQQESGWPDQVRMLKGLLQWLKATGPGSRSLEDLLELTSSESLTLARLQLISKQLLIYLDQMAARQDEQIGETIDAVASVLQEEEEFRPEVLESMGSPNLPPGRIWEPRLRPHLERQILARRQAAAAARTFAAFLTDRLNPLKEEELLRSIRTGSGESQKAPESWVSLTASVAESGGLEHLGNKFRNLMLLRQWGHPVPPAAGFPIGKEAQEVVRRMEEGVARVEGQIQDRVLQMELGARFADLENPLLLSVRSGALVDLPGQLATLENVGIHRELLPALENRIGSWAAWDAYRRFIQDFAISVYGGRYGFHRELFDRIIEGYKQKAGVEKKIQLSAEQMKEIALEYDEAVQLRVPGGIPENPREQLALAIQAVVDSWDQPQVQPIREIFGLKHEKGTAVILQAMIHGNFSRLVNGAEGHERSGAGVAFVSSDGEISEKGFVGSFGQGAQGSDVADGVITPEPLSRLEELMPEVFKELQERARDIQERSGKENEIEFTIQNGRLWLLQDRFVPIRGWVPKFRRETVGASILLGRGEGLAGGAVRGILAFPKSLEDPVRLNQLNQLAEKKKVEGLLLVMDTAAPEDTYFLRMPGVIGFLAHRGGKGQHEGMIATLFGLAAVAGLSGMELDSDNPYGGVHFHTDPLKKDPVVHVKEGDLVSVDGFSGEVYRGRIPLATEPSSGLEEGSQGAPPSVVVADDMDETKLGVEGVINVSALAKDQKRKVITETAAILRKFVDQFNTPAGLEEPSQRIERAIGRLSQSTFLPAVVSPKERALLGDLLQRVPVLPFDGKAIHLERGAIYLGMSPERDETTLARLLVWGGRVWRAMELVSEKGRALATDQPVLSQRLLSAADILQGVRIQLHTGPTTTVYKGKIFLAVGDSTTSPKLALELVRVAGVLSRDPATSSVSPVQKAEELALAFLGETDDAARQLFETARAEGEMEGQRAQKDQKPLEPPLDADLITRIKQYLELGNSPLEETWPVFAEDLSSVLRLASRDRQTQLLENLYNVFGLILYGKNTAADVGVRDEQTARLNIASMAAEAFAEALGRYLNDPLLGQKGTVSQRETLEEAARGMDAENLLSYLRFGHIPELLARKIGQQKVSPEIAHQLLREQRLTRGTSGMALTMQDSVRGMLTSQPTHTLLLTGPRPEETTSAGDASREPKPYVPELEPDAGYRIGADGLIDEFLRVLKGGPSLDNLVVPPVFLSNVRLALSRPQERTPSGSDELSDLLRFYHYLGSVGKLQKVWWPFLKEMDLSALAKEFQLSERAIVAGLFVWRVLQPPFDSDAEKILLDRLNELGKNTDAIFGFVAEFQKRFKTAQAVRKQVTEAAREAHHAAVVADLQPQRERRKDQERDELLERFAELGIPLGGPSTGGHSAGPAEDPGLSNAPTFEGFVYRLHRMVLDDEAVRSLNADRQAAQQAMARLVGGEKGAEGSFRPGRAAIIRPLHSDREEDPLRFYIAGEIEGEPLAKALLNFFEGFQGFPGSRWWKENTIGSRLQSFQAALPDFATARLEVKERAQGERLAHFEATLEDILRRLDSLERRLPSEGAGLEEVNLEGVAFLVFDAAAAPALARQLGPRGADLFVVAETPEIAQRLLEQGISVDRIIGATGRGFLEDDYRSVHSLIQRFVYSYPDDWQAKLVDSLRLERLSQTIYPIYDPESLIKVLDGLAVPLPLIRSILEERAGMEEGTGGEA